VIWTTNRLDAWTTVDLPVGPLPADVSAKGRVTEVTGLVRADIGFVAVGAADSKRSASHETWVSANGLTWLQLSSPDRPVLDHGPRLVADGPAGVIGIGASDASGARLTVWQLR
jgi:hypothetical protein